MLTVTFGIIAFENEDAAIECVTSVVYPTVEYYRVNGGIRAELICFDNSRQPNERLKKCLAACGMDVTYQWNGGGNAYYAGGQNRIVQLAKHEIYVYLCAAHCRMGDPTWLEDLVRPIRDDAGCGMAGHLQGCDRRPFGLPMDDGVDAVHIQGGVFAARTSLLRRWPYVATIPHAGTDLYISWRLMRAGYRLAHVPTVCSLWRQPPPTDKAFKLIHADFG